jgi:hypothetical protein
MSLRSFTRYWLPAIVVAGGIVAMILGPADGGQEGGAAIIGAGLAIWTINLLYRIGASGDRDRDREEQARVYFDRHGRWPDEPQ